MVVIVTSRLVRRNMQREDGKGSQQLTNVTSKNSPQQMATTPFVGVPWLLTLGKSDVHMGIHIYIHTHTRIHIQVYKLVICLNMFKPSAARKQHEHEVAQQGAWRIAQGAVPAA